MTESIDAEGVVPARASDIKRVATAQIGVGEFDRVLDSDSESLGGLNTEFAAESTSSKSAETGSKYKVCCVVWARSEEYAVNQLAPIGQAMAHRSKGIDCEVDVLVIEGFEYFQPMAERLKELNYNVIDKSEYFKSLVSRFQKLHDLYEGLHLYGHPGGFYFRNLTRWLVAADNAGHQSFFHIDADLVLNKHPDELIIDCGKKSFYAGSTCYIFIKDTPAFVERYEREISELADNPETYPRRISQSAIIRLTTEWGMHGITELHQLDEEKFFCYFVHQNPDFWARPHNSLHVYVPFKGYIEHPTNGSGGGHSPEPIRYEWRERTHIWNGRPLAYLHYQKVMFEILSLHRAQAILMIPEEVRWCLKPGPWPPQTKTHAADYLLSSLAGGTPYQKVRGEMPFTYSNIFQYYEEYGLENVFNDRFWHTAGTFAAPAAPAPVELARSDS